MCESGPLYLEYGHICHKSANFSKYGFSLKPKLDFFILVLLKPPKKACQPQNMANSEKTAKKSPKTKKMVQNEKNCF